MEFIVYQLVPCCKMLLPHHRCLLQFSKFSTSLLLQIELWRRIWRLCQSLQRQKKMRTEGKLHMSDTSIPQFAELPRLPTGVVCCHNIFAKNPNITINKVHQIIMKIIKSRYLRWMKLCTYTLMQKLFVYIAKLLLIYHEHHKNL